MEQAKIVTFTDLFAWQAGHELVLIIYKITQQFPKDESFGLISQLRRAVISITSNIAEGFGRKSPKDKTQFYKISIGSLMEVQNQLIIARDLNYITKQEFHNIYSQSVLVNKIICGLINKITKF